MVESPAPQVVLAAASEHNDRLRVVAVLARDADSSYVCYLTQMHVTDIAGRGDTAMDAMDAALVGAVTERMDDELCARAVAELRDKL